MDNRHRQDDELLDQVLEDERSNLLDRIRELTSTIDRGDAQQQ